MTPTLSQFPSGPWFLCVSAICPTVDVEVIAQLTWALMFVEMFAAIAVGVSPEATDVSTNSSP
jgi:hypothetical protein